MTATATILQDKWGYFWRVTEAHKRACSLSDDRGEVNVSEIDEPIAIVQDGQPTGHGDRLATRVALHMVNAGKW